MIHPDFDELDHRPLPCEWPVSGNCGGGSVPAPAPVAAGSFSCAGKGPAWVLVL